MYAWYKQYNENEAVRLNWEEDMSIAGSKNGIIVQELANYLTINDNPPCGWTIPIAAKYNKDDYSVIIDIKPKGDEIFLCELDAVFGYCFKEWTPIMLRLNLLYNDIYEKEFDKYSFIRPAKTDFLYTMLYLHGSIRNGEIHGTWKFPGPSPTNALLFWPEAMSFFIDQITKYDPKFTSEPYNLITLFGQTACR